MTTEATERDLVEEVEELLAKATPQWEQSQLAPAYVISLAEGHEVICSFGEYEKDGTLETEFKNAVNNMALTIRAPDLLRRLVEEVKTLRAVIRNGSPVGKLTAASVAEIKAALRSGASGSYLAEKYGVTDTTISLIKRGRTWRHVE